MRFWGAIFIGLIIFSTNLNSVWSVENTLSWHVDLKKAQALTFDKGISMEESIAFLQEYHSDSTYWNGRVVEVNNISDIDFKFVLKNNVDGALPEGSQLALIVQDKKSEEEALDLLQLNIIYGEDPHIDDVPRVPGSYRKSSLKHLSALILSELNGLSDEFPGEPIIVDEMQWLSKSYPAESITSQFFRSLDNGFIMPKSIWTQKRSEILKELSAEL